MPPRRLGPVCTLRGDGVACAPRAIGFTYSFSRISTAFASFIIGWFPQFKGTSGVFGLIAFARLMVVLSIGILGPRTSNLELEKISH
jgi:MFS transporter, putative metabolite:H+ symporter